MPQIDHFEIKNLMVFDFFEHLKAIEFLVKRTSSTLQFHLIIISVVEDLHVVLLEDEAAAVVVSFMVVVEEAINVVVKILEVVVEGHLVVVVTIRILVEVAEIYAMLNAITFIIPMRILVVKISLVVKTNQHMVKQMVQVIMAEVAVIGNSLIDLQTRPSHLFYLESSNRRMLRHKLEMRKMNIRNY